MSRMQPLTVCCLLIVGLVVASACRRQSDNTRLQEAERDRGVAQGHLLKKELSAAAHACDSDRDCVILEILPDAGGSCRVVVNHGHVNEFHEFAEAKEEEFRRILLLANCRLPSTAKCLEQRCEAEY